MTKRSLMSFVAMALLATSSTLAGGTALAASGRPAYTTSNAGYLVQSAGFSDVHVKITVPSIMPGIGGLVGVYFTDVAVGSASGCGWLGVSQPNGVIGAFNERSPGHGWVSMMISNINAGDRVTIDWSYRADGSMTCSVKDLTSGDTGTYTFPGPVGQVWNRVGLQAQITAAAIVPPTVPTVVTSFSDVSLTPVGGSPSGLSRWTAQPVITTLTGMKPGTIVAAPSAITRANAFDIVLPRRR